MLSRRRFFNAIGSAILGTAIALNLPETIVPTMKVKRHEEIIDAVFYKWLEFTYLSPYNNTDIFNVS